MFDTVASAWFGIVSGVVLLAIGFWLIGYYTGPTEGPQVVPNEGGPEELLDTAGGILLVYGVVRVIQGAVALWGIRRTRHGP